MNSSVSLTLPPEIPLPAEIQRLLNERFRTIEQTLGSSGNGKAGCGRHADRPMPRTTGLGGLYYENDRGLLYVSDSSKWLYVAGTMACTQSARPGDLSAADTGLLVNITDYAHLLRWNGKGFEWAPGDPGSDYVELRCSAPAGNGWQLCNGFIDLTYLKSDGTLDKRTMDDLLSQDTFPKFVASYTTGGRVVADPTGAPTGAISVTSASSGTTYDVASTSHYHQDPGAPPYLGLIPYYRR